MPRELGVCEQLRLCGMCVNRSALEYPQDWTREPSCGDEDVDFILKSVERARGECVNEIVVAEKVEAVDELSGIVHKADPVAVEEELSHIGTLRRCGVG